MVNGADASEASGDVGLESKDIMPKRGKSQWEFGDLFTSKAVEPKGVEPKGVAPKVERQVVTVGELTGRIKGLLEGQVGTVWVAGEVSNLRVQASGHMYFALKDAEAQLACVLFRGVVTSGRGAMRDGQKVVVQGEVTVYAPRGQYQMVVRSVEVQGLGALQAAFERLKAALQAEGLFAAERKRPLPRYPRRVGVVTSPTGAALQDVLHVLRRRQAGLEVVLAPCRVQGEGAGLEVAAAVAALNRWSVARGADGLDVILVTRGGGSLEDLWAFNEEVVARALAASGLPVVSAVGHEIDFTIADFVADVRAATPSAAAEILTAGYVEARDWVEGVGWRLSRLAMAGWRRQVERLQPWRQRLVRQHPRRQLEDRWQRVDELEAALVVQVRGGVGRSRERWEVVARRLRSVRPDRRLAMDGERVRRAAGNLERATSAALGRIRERLGRVSMRLGLLSPEHVLSRGYSITRDAATGRVLRRADEVRPGQRVRTRLAAGEMDSLVVGDEPGPGAE